LIAAAFIGVGATTIMNRQPTKVEQRDDFVQKREKNIREDLEKKRKLEEQ